MDDTIEIFKDDGGQWRWHRKAGNGEIISSGESHPHLKDCRIAAARANPDIGESWFQVVPRD